MIILKTKLILVPLLMLVLSIPIFAEPQTEDYSNIKGDFKILYLGDTKEVVDAKIKYLKRKKEIFNDRTLDYATTILNRYAFFELQYFDNKLTSIYFRFYDEYYPDQYDEFKKFVNEIITNFYDLYQKPIPEYKIPLDGEIEYYYQDYIFNTLVLEKKTISFGVYMLKTKLFKRYYNAIFIISDNELTALKNSTLSPEKQLEKEKFKQDF